MGFYDNEGKYHAEAWEIPGAGNSGNGEGGNRDDAFQPGQLGGTPYAPNDPRRPAYEGNDQIPNARVGIDNQPWWDWEHNTGVYAPSSTEYGGHAGGAEAEQQRYAGLAAAADARTAPQADLSAFYADMGMGDPNKSVFRTVQGGKAVPMRANAPAGTGNQDWQVNYYKDILGGGLTAADRQMQQGLAAGLGQTRSAVAGARGGGNALVAAQAAGADAAARQSGAYHAGYDRLRAGEILAAQQGLGAAATARRQQDLQASALYGDNAYKQAQLEAQQRGLNDQRYLDSERRRRDVFENQLAGQQFGEKTYQQAEQDQKAAQERADERRDAQRDRDINTITTTGGAFLGLARGSDVRVKKDVVPAGAQVDDAMDAMSPYGYRYKQPEKYGKGQQVGPMAQDLATTPAGRTAVTKMPDGKLGIDVGQGTKLSLAGLARLNERIRALEGQVYPQTEARPVTAKRERRYAYAGTGDERGRREGPLPGWQYGRPAAHGPGVVSGPAAPSAAEEAASSASDTFNRGVDQAARFVGEPRRPSPTVPARAPIGPTPTGAEIAQRLNATTYGTPNAPILPYYGPTPEADDISRDILTAPRRGR